MRNTIRILTVLVSAALAQSAGASLYSIEGGERSTAGTSYAGEDLWTSASARLKGGWYPYGALDLSRDSRYDWIAAPTLGLQKGIAGVGRLRLGYTRSLGRRADGQDAGAGTVEAGAFRALSLRSSVDLSYRWTHGALFSAGVQELDVATGQSRLLLNSADYHELSANGGLSLLSWDRPLKLGAGLTAGSGSSGLVFFAQSLSARYPLWSGLSADAGASFLQSNRAPSTVYFSLGLSYQLAGRF